MPKQVDLAAQRLSIANAAIAVIDRAGLEGARLRDVARAAQVTTGAVTHYFDNKDAVLEAALAEIVRRILDRQQVPLPPGPPAARAEALGPEALVEQACAFLPLDGEGRREWRVWLAFWGRAIAEPRLAAQHRDYYAAITGRLADTLAALAAHAGARLAEGQALALADAVVAAIDGIGTRATLEPETWPAARQRQTLGLLLTPLFAPLFAPPCSSGAAR